MVFQMMRGLSSLLRRPVLPDQHLPTKADISNEPDVVGDMISRRRRCCRVGIVISKVLSTGHLREYRPQLIISSSVVVSTMKNSCWPLASGKNAAGPRVSAMQTWRECWRRHDRVASVIERCLSVPKRNWFNMESLTND